MIRGRSQPSHSLKPENCIKAKRAHNFMTQELVKANLMFLRSMMLRRTCDVVEIKIINNEVKTGYIPSLNLGDNIYVDEAIVNNVNRRANIKIFNTNEKDTKIKIQTVQLEELEIADEYDVPSLEHDAYVSEMQEFSPSGKRATESISDYHSIINKTKGNANRNKTVNSISSSFQIDHASKTISKASESEYEQLLRYIKLDSLNKDEKEVVKRMIMDSADLFHLPGDKLTFTKDDIIIYSSSLDEHMIKFRNLLDRFRSTEVKPDPGNRRAVKEFPRRKTTKNVKQD
uniref:Uncharacterized protein n=1 Tax=Vespula pensylvanica TaxID=30213 RepID=A0A834JPY6_VESPE|nr:hypothetical protein H0235_017465 [Vespula pensylvanica]